MAAFQTATGQARTTAADLRARPVTPGHVCTGWRQPGRATDLRHPAAPGRTAFAQQRLHAAAAAEPEDPRCLSAPGLRPSVAPLHHPATGGHDRGQSRPERAVRPAVRLHGHADAAQPGALRLHPFAQQPVAGVLRSPGDAQPGADAQPVRPLAAGLARDTDPWRLPGAVADHPLRADVRLSLFCPAGPAPAEQAAAGRHADGRPVQPVAAVRRFAPAEPHHLRPGGPGRPEHAVHRRLSLAQRLPPGALLRGRHGYLQHRRADRAAGAAGADHGRAPGPDRHPAGDHVPERVGDEHRPGRAPAQHHRERVQRQPRPRRQQRRGQCQGRVPGQDQPRDPHTDERRAGHDRAAAGHATVGQATRLRADHPQCRQRAADPDQRDPRHFQARVRADRAGRCAVRPQCTDRGLPEYFPRPRPSSRTSS
ncbi:hypothetical protein ACVWZ9_002589 [Pseudomonas chlororaphis]